MKSRGETDLCSYWDHSECEGTPQCPPRCPRFTDENGTPALVRPYRERDFEELVTMYEGLDESAATMGVPPFTRPRIEDWLTDLSSDGWNLVARLNDQIVGHIAVVPAEAAAPEFVVFVHTDFQNRGIGTELLRHLVARADANGHEELRLGVSNDNKRAITVYENIGFERVTQSELNAEMRLPLTRPLTDRLRRPPADRN